MGQFYITDNGKIRFDCNCGRPFQPFVDKKTEIIRCEECGKIFTNPFHKNNPYNINSRLIHPPEIQGIKDHKLFKILTIIIILSILSGLIVYILETAEILQLKFLSLYTILPVLIVAIITMVSLVSIFAVFGKNRVLKVKEEFAKPIRARLKKYSHREVGLSGITHYKFDTDVLDGLKKGGIKNNDWFFDFINIETYNELESCIIEEKLKKNIIRPGLGIVIVTILLLPFSTLLKLFNFIEISVTMFIMLFFLWLVYLSFNYIYVVFEIFSIDLKLIYWMVKEEKHLRVSRVIEMFTI